MMPSYIDCNKNVLFFLCIRTFNTFPASPVRCRPQHQQPTRSKKQQEQQQPSAGSNAMYFYPPFDVQLNLLLGGEGAREEAGEKGFRNGVPHIFRLYYKHEHVTMHSAAAYFNVSYCCR